jgi:hypothetical protein
MAASRPPPKASINPWQIFVFLNMSGLLGILVDGFDASS